MKILLAIDHSKFLQEAMRTIASQIRTKGAKVRVLHVVEPISGYISADMIPHSVPYVAKVEEERRKEARELVQRAKFGNCEKRALRQVKSWKRVTRKSESSTMWPIGTPT